MKLIFFVLSITILLLVTGCEEVVKELTTTISGRVYDEGEPVSGALIFVLEFNGDGTIPSGMSLENGSVSLSDGGYVVVEVETGEYMVLAVKDVNGNMSYDSGIDEIGFYGELDPIAEIITIPTKVTVENDGDDIENIDINDMYVSPI